MNVRTLHQALHWSGFSPFSTSCAQRAALIVLLSQCCWLAACHSLSPHDSQVRTVLPKPSPVVEGDSIRFGVLAIDSAVSVNERYGPLMEYLSHALGRPVELTTLSQESQFTQVKHGRLDFATSNPLSAVQLQRMYGTQFLVTHTRPETGDKFSGLIIAHRDSEIQTLRDLKGKRAACVAFQTAAAGCTFQIYHLLQNGIDPYLEFSSFIENSSQDNIVLAVLNGSIDVGFIRTGQLEKMLAKGLISNLEDIRIIDPQNDDFFYAHTTDLYPEWPIASLPKTDPGLVEQVREALLKIPDDHEALQSLKVNGFTPAVDYSSLNALIETLQLRSWDVQATETTSETISR